MAKLKRIARDGLILVAICGGLYLLTSGTRMIKGETVDRVSDFSTDRQMAERLLIKKRYGEALPFFEKLTRQDRFNSYAWYKQGHCAFQVAESFLSELEDLPAADPKREEALRNYDEYINRAANAFEQVLSYPRLRNRARYNLAVIHTSLDDPQKALGYLRDAVDDGFFTHRGLNRYRSFQKLKGIDEFISICRQEHRNAMLNINSSGRPTVGF